MERHLVSKILNRMLITALVTIIWTGVSMAEKGAAFSYDRYAKVLSRYVDEKGLIDYKGLKVNRAQLDIFVDRMARMPHALYEGWSKEEKIAFWINAYNAFTLRAIIDHYPVKSIKEIGSVFQSVWDKLKFQVMSREITLNEIEHKILRKQFREPRIHMAINCASMGCPALRREPFTGTLLEEQLDDQTRIFLTDSAKFRIDRHDKRVYISHIFKWFGEDFIAEYGGGKSRHGLNEEEGAVLNFISRYLNAQDREFLAASELRIKYLDYDWSLNEQ